NPDARTVDWDKVAADTRTIVETEASLVAAGGPQAAPSNTTAGGPQAAPSNTTAGGANERKPSHALPYESYLFLWHVSPRGRGGLEHKTCATLMAKPTSFQTRTGYLDVLSLIAHEFFHLWNVKRARPAGLAPYRYEDENYTRLLWWFEGATSYYDWRTLRL